MWRLQEILQEVAGLDACSLQPAAGSQGELTGLMLMRAYFEDRGEGEQRDTIITADTAHGTNPASVTMAGYKLEKVGTDARGNLDLDDLRSKVNERTAGLMLTNPSTLGLFDEHIEEVAEIFHDAGSLLYYDGANLNAVCGISRPGDMGFDIVHINLHKTFSQPHGGGGPGGGPIVVRSKLEPFLPVPAIVKDGDGFRLDYDRPKSIGKVRGFTGPFGVFVRSYAYIRSYGPALREMSEVAVLNANYLLARLRDAYDLPYDRLCMHEFVLSARSLKREHGITALDVAKRLMDYDFHPPTIYFPLVVPEALMIEPTETEPKERLDAFVDAMLAIAREAADDPELLREAPQLPPGAPARRGESCEAGDRQVRLRRASGSRRRARRGPSARSAEGSVMSREEIAHRVDELAREYSGPAFVDAIQRLLGDPRRGVAGGAEGDRARPRRQLRPGRHGASRRRRLVSPPVGQGLGGGVSAGYEVRDFERAVALVSAEPSPEALVERLGLDWEYVAWLAHDASESVVGAHAERRGVVVSYGGEAFTAGFLIGVHLHERPVPEPAKLTAAVDLVQERGRHAVIADHCDLASVAQHRGRLRGCARRVAGRRRRGRRPVALAPHPNLRSGAGGRPGAGLRRRRRRRCGVDRASRTRARSPWLPARSPGPARRRCRPPRSVRRPGAGATDRPSASASPAHSSGPTPPSPS